MTQNPLFFSRRYEVAELAVRMRLPAMYGYREFVQAGGLLSYGSSLPGAYRQSVRLIDKILKGTSPADLPFELATRFEGAVAGVVGIEGGVVSGVINLESSGVGASDWRPRHAKHYQQV
jgi:hypothetical protein